MTRSSNAYEKLAAYPEDSIMIRHKRRNLFVIGGIVLSTVYLIQYSRYEFNDSSSNRNTGVNLKSMKNSQHNREHKGKIYPRGIILKVNKGTGETGWKCTVTVAIILCQDSSSDHKVKNAQGYTPATDFTRQINQTVVMLKSIVLLTKFTAKTKKEDADCVNVIILSDTKGHYNTVVNKIDRDEKWSEDFRKRIKLSYMPVQYPAGSQWMRKLFRPCATLRLFLAELLPTYDSIIYLDTDIIFFQSVQNLWSQFKELSKPGKESNSPIAAMAPCLFHYGTKLNEVPYYGTSGLNAGIMLMNLTRMRNTLWTHKIRMVTTMFQNKIKLADQEECGKNLAELLGHYRHLDLQQLAVKPQDLKVGLVVVAQTAPRMFCRAQIAKLTEGSRYVFITNVDTGEIHEVEKSKLFGILPRFMSVAFQVAPVELLGLELFRNTSILKDLAGEKTEKFYQQLVYVTSFERKDYAPSVMIFVDEAKTKCLNKIVKEHIISFSPKLPAPLGSMIVHAESDGRVWIQKDSELTRLLQSFTQPDPRIMQEYYYSKRRPKEVEIEALKFQLARGDKIFFGRYTDGIFYRTYLHSTRESMTKFDVEFMEFGNRATLHLRDIKICEDFGEHVGFTRALPAQVIKAQMAGIGYVNTTKLWKALDVGNTLFSAELAEGNQDLPENNDIPLVNIYMWPEGEDGPRVLLNELLVTDQIATVERKVNGPEPSLAEQCVAGPSSRV